MNARNIVNFQRSIGLTLLLATSSSVFAQQTLTLVGPTTRNGSFEDGITSPWGGVSFVNQDVSFANHGLWFGGLSETANGPMARTDSWQSIPVEPLNGRTFILTFDVRNGPTGFDSVTGSVAGSLPWIPAQQHILDSPSLRIDEWVTQSMTFTFPSDWDGNNIRLSVKFIKNDAVVGTTYTAYLDNVVLQQVPEPATWTLLAGGLCGVVAGIRLFRKRRLNLALPAR